MRSSCGRCSCQRILRANRADWGDRADRASPFFVRNKKSKELYRLHAGDCQQYPIASQLAFGMRGGFVPRAPRCLTLVIACMRGGFAPRAPHWGAQRAPKPPAFDAWRTIKAPAHASGVASAGSSVGTSFCLEPCLHLIETLIVRCLLQSARRHVRLTLGIRIHRIGARRGASPSPGCRVPAHPAARRAGELLSSRGEGRASASPLPPTAQGTSFAQQRTGHSSRPIRDTASRQRDAHHASLWSCCQSSEDTRRLA
jgi:hypothetical protein